MKKIWLALLIFLVSAAFAFALPPVWGAGGEEVALKYNTQISANKLVVTATITSDDSGNVAITPLGDQVVGTNLFDIPLIYSTTDDAFTVTLVSGMGVPLISYAATSATTGERTSPTDRFSMIDAPWVDVTGLAAGETAIVVFVFWRDT